MVKIFTQCLQEFLRTIIQPNQTRFIEGRNIIVNLFLTQEAMEQAKENGQDKWEQSCQSNWMFVWNLSMQNLRKGIQLINYSFLFYALKTLGFISTW